MSQLHFEVGLPVKSLIWMRTLHLGVEAVPHFWHSGNHVRLSDPPDNENSARVVAFAASTTTSNAVADGSTYLQYLAKTKLQT